MTKPLLMPGEPLDCGHVALDPGPEGGSLGYLRDRDGATKCLDCFASRQRCASRQPPYRVKRCGLCGHVDALCKCATVRS